MSKPTQEKITVLTSEPLPPKLESWIYWRDKTTEPKKQPFSTVLEHFGIEPYKLTGKTIRGPGGNSACIYCKGSFTIKRPANKEELYCLCHVLDWQRAIADRYKEYRSPVKPAFLDEITYPKSLGQETIRELKILVKATEKFIKTPDRWMLVLGTVGLGKTHMLRAINTALSPVAIYIAARDIEGAVHATRKDDTLGEFINNLTFAPVLLLDDLGEEYGGRLVKSVIDRVINARYEKFPKYPVVVASNFKTEDMIAYLPRTADRLLDKERCTQYTMFSKNSFRRLHAEMRA